MAKAKNERWLRVVFPDAQFFDIPAIDAGLDFEDGWERRESMIRYFFEDGKGVIPENAVLHPQPDYMCITEPLSRSSVTHRDNLREAKAFLTFYNYKPGK